MLTKDVILTMLFQKDTAITLTVMNWIKEEAQDTATIIRAEIQQEDNTMLRKEEKHKEITLQTEPIPLHQDKIQQEIILITELQIPDKMHHPETTIKIAV